MLKPQVKRETRLAKLWQQGVRRPLVRLAVVGRDTLEMPPKSPASVSISVDGVNTAFGRGSWPALQVNRTKQARTMGAPPPTSVRGFPRRSTERDLVYENEQAL